MGLGGFETKCLGLGLDNNSTETENYANPPLSNSIDNSMDYETSYPGLVDLNQPMSVDSSPTGPMSSQDRSGPSTLTSVQTLQIVNNSWTSNAACGGSPGTTHPDTAGTVGRAGPSPIPAPSSPASLGISSLATGGQNTTKPDTHQTQTSAQPGFTRSVANSIFLF